MRLRTLAWAFALVIVFVLPTAVRWRPVQSVSDPIFARALALYDPSGTQRIEDVADDARALFGNASSLPTFSEGYVPRVFWFRVTFPRVGWSTPPVLAYTYKVTQIDVYRVAGGGFIEHFRRAPDGRIAETQYQLVSHEDSHGWGTTSEGYWAGAADDGRYLPGRSYYSAPGSQQPLTPQSFVRGLFGPLFGDPDDPRAHPGGGRPN